jgi:hypothetical protein
MICASRGPAFGPCGRPNATAAGRGWPRPRPKFIFGRRRDKFKVRRPTTGSRSLAGPKSRVTRSALAAWPRKIMERKMRLFRVSRSQSRT